MTDPLCYTARVKNIFYAQKSWWPRTDKAALAPTSPQLPLDRLAVFRHLVAVAARRRGLPVRAQNFVVAAVGGLDAATLRPDLARHAQEWVAQHQKLPRDPRPKRIRPIRPIPPTLPPALRNPPKPETLEREALVVQLLEVEKTCIREVAVRLGHTREKVRQIHARARRRRRDQEAFATLQPTPSIA